MELEMPDRKLRLFEIGQLRAALAVWQEGGVTQAAQRIGLTQPAVSRLVSSLETDLGLVLSEQGRVFLGAAEGALGGVARLSDLAAELRRGRSGLLRIAAVSALAHGLAPAALAALMKEFPDLSVEVEERDRTEQLEGLMSGHLDVGLVALPSGAPGLHVDMIVEADAVCLLPEGHKLAAHDTLDPMLLHGHNFIRLNEMRLLQQLVDDAFDRLGQRRLSTVVVDSTPLMIAFVAGGMGLAITHRMSTFVLPKGVVARPFLPRLTFGYAALTRTEDHRSPVITAFIALARSIAARMLDQSGTTGPSTIDGARR
jgi:DNA-binding transcriptional LysR family regulator